jgi:ubiquinone/menaquinone biosynthesis C-methylase UbiE
MIVRKTEGGQSWVELAQLDPLASVLDPADRRGGKNRLIDRVHKRALGRALGNVDGSTVLDFGCGTGRLSAWLVGHGARVEGVDITPEMVAVARTRVPQARFQTIEGATLPFGDGQFDAVVTAYVLQYYVAGDAAVPRELARVLRGGGKLVAIEQVAEDEIGRGGTIAAYEAMFGAAGLRSLDVELIRVGDSRLVAVAQRFPTFARLPIVPRLVTIEAKRQASVPLTNGRYADVVFRAAKADA